jgi:hypothetical protein
VKYKYLGITLQTTATSFSIHIQERAAAAIKAMYNIKNITSLSTSTSMLLFSTTIAPIITYGIHVIWDKLTIGELNKIEKIKAMFMKRAMGVGKTAPSRLVYQLMRETYFVEDIRLQHHLQELMKSRDRKREEIDPEFYNTTAMLERTWSRECQDQRHVETHLAVHGFHHKICRNTKFHKPDKDCVCMLCGQGCDTYHITRCTRRIKSITEHSKE